ncbi:MAG: hypothetical protein JWO90_1740 [Solirubrobacterales bacterium]|nr:hypothetical protein [Solirubrobacterales bacterium]
MTAATTTLARRLSSVGTLGRALDGPAFASWLLPFALILILALSGGGYDPLVRGQVGVAAWWLVIVGAATGVVPMRHGRLGWAAFAVFAAFVAWSAVGLAWTESTERTVAEVARITTYAGLLLLGLSTQGRVAARHAINGAGTAIALVASIAVLSRLHPEWFTSPVLYETFPSARPRLAFPLGYWNLLAGLVAMGIPLLFAIASTGRTIPGRVLAGAALPIMGLCAYLTVSRGGLAAAAGAVLVFFLLAPERLPRLALLAVTGAGTAVLCVAADRREDLQQNIAGAAALQQGDELLGLVVFVCIGAGLLSWAIALADRHAAPPGWLAPSRRVAAPASVLVAVLAAIAFVGAGGAGWAQDRFESFKGQPSAGVVGDDAVSRFSSVSSNGRWEYWVAARNAAFDERPWGGLGPGTFELYWARAGTISGGYVRDAHSLWFQTLAETGLVGLVLIAGLFLLAIVAGAVRTLRARAVEERVALAAACGGLTAFLIIASVEWAWQVPVLPAAALVLVAVAVRGVDDPPLLAPRAEAGDSRVGRARERPLSRRFGLGVVAAGLAAVAVIAVPLAGLVNVRASEALVRQGNTTGALERAQNAQVVQPYGVSARLQKALVLERARRIVPALLSARSATSEEPTNWRAWLVRSRLEAQSGDAAASVRSYRQARSLNPRSPIFAAAG